MKFDTFKDRYKKNHTHVVYGGDSKPYIINDERFVSMISQCNWNIGPSNEKQIFGA